MHLCGIKHRLARPDCDSSTEESQTFGERIADVVASFGGSWNFIIIFGFVILLYALINIELKGNAWDPYPFILLTCFCR